MNAIQAQNERKKKERNIIEDLRILFEYCTHLFTIGHPLIWLLETKELLNTVKWVNKATTATTKTDYNLVGSLFSFFRLCFGAEWKGITTKN